MAFSPVFEDVTMLDPVGFWSYARHDDAHSDGQLSQLRVIVGKSIGLQYGAEVMLWQDIAAIPFGADWAATIDHTISQTTFFIPIITPRFLKSQNCYEEFLAFQQRMRDIGRDDLIFPLHYVNVDDMGPKDTVFGDDLALLYRHQWIDFRSLFYADPRSPEVRSWAGSLAAAILRTMRQVPSPGPQTKAETSETIVESTPARLGVPTFDPSPQASMPAGILSTPGEEQPARETHRVVGPTAQRVFLFSGGLCIVALVFLFLYPRIKTETTSALPWSGPPALAGPTSQPVSPSPPAPRSTVADSPSSSEQSAQAAQSTGVVLTGEAADYDRLASAGNVDAMVSLGNLYDQGSGGAPLDYVKAKEWYEKAASANNAEAMDSLGWLYYEGKGFPKDIGKARDWYAKAAAADNVAGWRDLGWLYEHAEGVQTDYVLASTYYQKAALRGDKEAMENLASLYEQGKGVPQDARKASEWRAKAAALKEDR